MHLLRHLPLIVLPALLGASCMPIAPRSPNVGGGIPAAPAPDPRVTAAREVSALREENDMLRARIADIETQMQTVVQESARARQEAMRDLQSGTQAAGERTAAMDRRMQETERRVAELDRKLAELDASRKKDLQQMQDRILGELATLLKEQERRPSASRGASASSGGGNEHVVAAGESLSIIAREHGTTTQKLMEANGLTNANQIRVGQRLRIP